MPFIYEQKLKTNPLNGSIFTHITILENGYINSLTLAHTCTTHLGRENIRIHATTEKLNTKMDALLTRHHQMEFYH